MKTKITSILGLGVLLALTCGNLSAQNTQTTGKTSSTTASQAVSSQTPNPDLLVVTGKIIDATTKEPITNAKINYNKFGEELVHATIDEKGNYALVLNKKELGEPIRVIFKIAGYKKFVVKSVDKTVSHLDADLFLQPDGSEAKSNANIKYIMDNSPFNTMVIKMQ
jgi:hypothetical protein